MKKEDGDNGMKKIDEKDVRADFPILARKVNGKRLIYLDNAATSQKPSKVIDAEAEFYRKHNANVHRGVHTLSQEATRLYEDARQKVEEFINARSRNEIIFTRSATESLNLILHGYALPKLRPGDEIILSKMEHHSNLVPWIWLAKRQGIVLKYLPFDEKKAISPGDVQALLSPRTRMVTITHVSNVLGVKNPAEHIGNIVREYARKTGQDVAYVVDASQSIPHMPVDVQAMQADFVVFSGHKMLAPTGVGVLYGRENILQKMEPFNVGSDMIAKVSLHDMTWNDVPYKFEAGTSNIAGAVALGAAIDYLNNLGMKNIMLHERELTAYALQKLSSIEGIRIYGSMNPDERIGVLSFNISDIHPHDVATILDEDGIAIRSGHHCAQPLMGELKADSTCRASLYMYNTKEDIDALVESLEKTKKIFRPKGK